MKEMHAEASDNQKEIKGSDHVITLRPCNASCDTSLKSSDSCKTNPVFLYLSIKIKNYILAVIQQNNLILIILDWFNHGGFW